MENWGKDGIWELKVLEAYSLKIYPVLLQFIEKKMENRGKDWIWQVSRINSTWRMTFQSEPRFSIIIEKNVKSG